jgi:hypothetical protein
MRTSVKIGVAVYLVVMAGCVVAFFAQQSVVNGDHIRPGLRDSRSPVGITLRDRQSGEVREAELTFVNDSVVTNPLRMGNEIEEHLLSLMAANLATGMMLLFVAVTASKKAEPAG